LAITNATTPKPERTIVKFDQGPFFTAPKGMPLSLPNYRKTPHSSSISFHLSVKPTPKQANT
jgi:hypothetical protein